MKEELKKKIEDIIENTTTYIPYEGYDINKEAMIEEILKLIDEQVLAAKDQLKK